MNDNIIVGLDIGSQNIRVVVIEKDELGKFHLIGFGKSESKGMRKGSVTNIENTVKGINDAVEAAEMMCGIDITHCVVGLGGDHIESLNSGAVYPITAKGKNNPEIDQADIDSVIEFSRRIAIPIDREIIHVVPRSYRVDKQENIKDPLNMIGIRLEAEVHIITGSVTSIKNIISCVNRAGLHVDNVMLHGLSDIKAVMTKDEQNLGSILIDIGAGTTEVIVIKESAPIMTFTLPLGGNQVTNDLAILKKLPFDVAEQIKISEGCCWLPFIDEGDSILLDDVAGRGPEEILKTEIVEIFQARMAEIFMIIKDKIFSSNIDKNFFSGLIVLCGGGALINGASELAGEVFNVKTVKIGIPILSGKLLNEYRTSELASVIGLVLNEFETKAKTNLSSVKKNDIQNSIFQKILYKIKYLIKELF